jgi:hypothetical protein
MGTYSDLTRPRCLHGMGVTELGLEGKLEPVALVKEWEKELAALASSVKVKRCGCVASWMVRVCVVCV